MSIEFFCHWYTTPANVLAVSTTLCPAQNVVAPWGVTVGVGLFISVNTVAPEVAEHTPPCVTTTVYEPAVLLLYVWLVAPVSATPFLRHW